MSRNRRGGELGENLKLGPFMVDASQCIGREHGLQFLFCVVEKIFGTDEPR
jgi:hypothetical protein